MITHSPRVHLHDLALASERNKRASMKLPCNPNGAKGFKQKRNTTVEQVETPQPKQCRKVCEERDTCHSTSAHMHDFALD